MTDSRIVLTDADETAAAAPAKVCPTHPRAKVIRRSGFGQSVGMCSECGHGPLELPSDER